MTEKDDLRLPGLTVLTQQGENRKPGKRSDAEHVLARAKVVERAQKAKEE